LAKSARRAAVFGVSSVATSSTTRAPDLAFDDSAWRSHEIGLPKKVRALALRHALSSKAKSGALVVLDVATLETPKTAALRADFAKIGVINALVITGPEVDGAFKLAARNIPHVDVLPNAGLNVYDILRRDTLVLTKAALEGIAARFAEDNAAGKEAA
jgi:large subunit ribosomal protein L4